jgi:hypothetical protein
VARRARVGLAGALTLRDRVIEHYSARLEGERHPRCARLHSDRLDRLLAGDTVVLHGWEIAAQARQVVGAPRIDANAWYALSGDGRVVLVDPRCE